MELSHQLHSQQKVDLLNEIDQLRSQGVSQFVHLPQLIVCGDQSSGKSSVLEAISSIPFPTKENLCTRFATEVILRNAAEETIYVSIVPDQEKSPEERGDQPVSTHALVI
jgi:Dynamin family